jgi:hypothetical protein
MQSLDDFDRVPLKLFPESADFFQERVLPRCPVAASIEYAQSLVQLIETLVVSAQEE